jgi:hypothetical protein
MIAIQATTGDLLWFTKRKVFLLGSLGDIKETREHSAGEVYSIPGLHYGKMYLKPDGTTLGHSLYTHWAYKPFDLPEYKGYGK